MSKKHLVPVKAQVLEYSFESDLLVISVRTETDTVVLGKISIDVQEDTLQSFIDSCIYKYEQQIYAAPAYSIGDIFNANGSLKYLALKGYLNDWYFSLNLPNSKPIRRKATTLVADVEYYAFKLAQYWKISTESITYALLRSAIENQFRGRLKCY